MSGRRYQEKTIKILFGRATWCAYPGCEQRLIFEDRGKLTVVAQIAHIRSESPDGPRYDAQYPVELIDSEENLLLLCGIHHKPVDDHESLYNIDELADWKTQQVASGTPREFSEQQIAQVMQYVEQALTALSEVRLAVQPVGVIIAGHTRLSVPLAGLARTTLSVPDQDRYLGVQIVNDGLVAVTIDAVGIELDVDASDQGYPNYQFVLDDPVCCPPRRINSKSSATWLAHPPTVGAMVLKIAEDYLRLPRQFRAYALPGAGSRVVGEWVPATQLPIWEAGMTEERLQDLLTQSAEARRRFEA